MDGIYQAWQTGLLWVCLCALGAMAAWLFLAKVAAPAWDAVRRWWSLPCIQRVIVGVCVIGLSYYGATKQAWHVGYDGGIKAGATANVVTNDTVSIHWQRDTSGGVYVPETATVYIDYRPNTETNAEWGTLAQTTVGAWGWSGTVENATNYDYNVWAYYIPPEPVHTNGVLTYKTHFDRRGEYVLPLRARVEVNGVAIVTPAAKRRDAVPTARDYVQDGLIAMWDGIENAGWGTHDPNATVWKDLVGNYDGTVGANVVVMDNCMSFNGTKGEANAVKVGKVTFGSPQFVTFEAVFIKDHDAEVSAYNEAVFGQTESRTSMVTMFVKSRLSVQYVKLGTSTTLGINYGSAPFGLREMMSASFRYASDKIQLFKDGVVVASQSNDSTPIDMSSTSYNFYIGGDAYNPEEYTLLGRVFNLRIYNRALTAEEIAYNYNVDKERFNLP